MTRVFGAFIIAWTIGAPTAAAAQGRPTVFLHGFGASASDWAATADRLRAVVAIEPHIPEMAWRSEFQSQAKDLQATTEFAGLPTNAVAIGHSNGGLVAREWSKTHRLDGVVTMGTPHSGVPILFHLQSWFTMAQVTQSAVARVASAFTNWSDWIWVYPFVDSAVRWISDFNIWSVANLATAVGMQAVTPVAYQMLPGSSYLGALNGSANLTREASRVPNRVGIASIAHNFYYAGPARAIAPDSADAIASLMYGSASALLLWGNYLMVSASPTDLAAMDQALSLTNLAFQILSVDELYCRMVSSPDLGECVANDGVVSINSQIYPGAANFLIGGLNDGPAHKQEKQRSDDALYAALTTYVHVPLRSASAPAPMPAPAPLPQPAPSDPEPSAPAEPSGSSAAPTVFVAWLPSGQQMRREDRLDSYDGRWHLLYQHDGNLVLYDANWRALWATGTDGTAPGVVAMQGDGNLVVYDATGIARWASERSFGHSGASLAMQDDGNLVIYSADGAPLWATGALQ